MKRDQSISNKSIFGEYRNPEDRVTAALLHIFMIGGPEMMSDIFEDYDIELEAQVNTQVKRKGGKSRPDGELLANYHLYIESKVQPWNINYEHNVQQLRNHQQLIIGNDAKLLYITIEEECPPEIIQSGKLYWINWRMIVDRLNAYEPRFNKEVIRFLVDQFELLVENIVLCKYDNTTDDNRVIIVGGRYAERIAIDYKFYSCQAGRSFRKSKYIAFYYDKRISHVFEIEGDPMQVSSLERVISSIGGGYVLNDEDKKPHTFFKLGKEFPLDHTIRHRHSTPYVRRQRYTSIDKIHRAETTDDL